MVVLLLVGGGWYFLQNYEIGGLDGVTVNPKNGLEVDATYITYRDATPIIPSDVSLNPFGVRESIPTENPFSRERIAAVRGPQESSSAPTVRCCLGEIKNEKACRLRFRMIEIQSSPAKSKVQWPDLGDFDEPNPT